MSSPPDSAAPRQIAPAREGVFSEAELPEVFLRISDAVAARFVEDGTLRAEFERGVERAVLKERSLDLLTAEEVADWLRLRSGKVVGNLARAGRLPAPLKVGREHLWRRGDLWAFVRTGHIGTVGGSGPDRVLR